MKKIVTFFRDLHEDKSGVTFIEYTALLGVILAVASQFSLVLAVGPIGTWTYLCSTLSGQHVLAA